jgi:hypothetical protein
LVKIKSVNVSSEVLDRISKIEVSLAEGFRNVEAKLSTGIFEIVNDGLKTHRLNLLKDNNITKRIQWLEKIRTDKDLRFPHKKILDFLLDQFDFTKNEFKGIQFSKLVKEAHVGKNMANNYLSLLEQKGYIEKRNDGYRTFFKIRG